MLNSSRMPEIIAPLVAKTHFLYSRKRVTVSFFSYISRVSLEYETALTRIIGTQLRVVRV